MFTLEYLTYVLHVIGAL